MYILKKPCNKQPQKIFFYNNRGFTLLELLVAITIMMVITAIGVVSYATVTRRARDTRRVSDIEQIRQALEMYRSDNGYYPMTGNGSAVEATNAVGTVLKNGGYLQKIPLDPKSGSYVYQAVAGPVLTQAVQYCVSTDLENTPADSGSCAVALPTGKDYGLGNP